MATEKFESTISTIQNILDILDTDLKNTERMNYIKKLLDLPKDADLLKYAIKEWELKLRMPKSLMSPMQMKAQTDMTRFQNVYLYGASIRAKVES